MLSQQHISPQTPTGATLGADGATFRVWAPEAGAVYLHGIFEGQVYDQLTDDRLLRKDERGYWAGYQAGRATATAIVSGSRARAQAATSAIPAGEVRYFRMSMSSASSLPSPVICLGGR